MIIKEAERLSFIKEYYFSKKLREIRGMIADGIPVINLGIGNPDLAPDSSVIDQLKASAEATNNHGYQPYKGIPDLAKAFSGWYKKTYDVDLIPSSEILPLLGSKEGVHYISEAFINPGDIALVPNPGYPAYNSALRIAGANPITYDLDENNNWAPDWSSISTEALHKAKLIWLSYPNMPTGAVGSHAIFEKIIEIALEYKLLVINDNPYSLVLNEDRPLSIHQVPNSKKVALELNSLSKSHNMAGWRIGVVTGHEDYLNSILKVKSNVDSGMFKPLQEAAIKALALPQSWHDARNAIYRERKQHVLDIMDLLNCTYDAKSTGMFVWGRIPDSWDKVESLTEKILQEAHVFVTPGFIFGSKGERYIRISLCSNEAALIESKSRIKTLLS